MNVDRAVFALAGTMVLVSLALGYWVSPYWLLLDRLCRAQYAAGRIHRFLPGRYDLQQAGPEDRLRVYVFRTRAIRRAA